jgi:hypothetical protein
MWISAIALLAAQTRWTRRDTSTQCAANMKPVSCLRDVRQPTGSTHGGLRHKNPSNKDLHATRTDLSLLQARLLKMMMNSSLL